MNVTDAVIAMHEAHEKLMLARTERAVRPGDALAREQVREAEQRYRELSTRVVPGAMRTVPTPCGIFSVFVNSADGELLDKHTVALDREIRVHVGSSEHRSRVLDLLGELGHPEIVDRLRGESAKKRRDIANWQRELTEFASDHLDRRSELPWKSLGIKIRRFAKLI